VEDVVGYSFDLRSGKCLIALGDVYFDEEREIMVALAVPKGSGSRRLASGGLQLGGSTHWSGTAKGFATEIRYTSDQTVVERNRDLGAQSRADVAISTRSVEKALQLLDEGKNEEAKRSLDEAKSALAASPAAAVAGSAGEAIQSQVEALEEYEQIMEDSKDDARRAKKSIQYDNYRTQKKKK